MHYILNIRSIKPLYIYVKWFGLESVS